MKDLQRQSSSSRGHCRRSWHRWGYRRRCTTCIGHRFDRPGEARKCRVAGHFADWPKMKSGLIRNTRSRKERSCGTYLVGLLATLGRSTVATGGTFPTSDGEGREGQNRQEKSGCADEHVERLCWLKDWIVAEAEISQENCSLEKAGSASRDFIPFCVITVRISMIPRKGTTC